MNSWLVGGPIIAALVACWTQVQGVLNKLRSMVLVKVLVENNLAEAVAFFCWTKMRQLKIGDFKYTSRHNYIKPLERYQYVAYECISQSDTLFLWGWRPLLIGVEATRTPGSGGDGTFTFTFVRGTIDIDQMMIEAIELYNQRVHAGFKKTRFYISRNYGTFGMAPGQNNMAEDKSKAPKPSDENALWQCRVLRWAFEQLGEQTHASGKPFEFLVFPDNIWEAVRDIERWLESERWYRDKGIPWKRGWLLYGPPGTGKTSLVRSIGEYLDIPITVFSLSTYSDKEFQNDWSRLRHRVPCIALIEDIDTVFHGREHTSRGASFGKPLSFETLLNTVDGIENSDGVFTIVTTNCVDQLDPALGKPTNGDEISTRPGRIDRVLKLDIMGESERRQLAERILVDCSGRIDKLVEDGEGDTPAQFQDRCARVALKEYWRTYAPLPPGVLADARQETIHQDLPGGRAARAIRVPMTEQEKTG